VLEDIAANKNDTWIRIAAAGMIGDQPTLVEIANGDNKEYKREEAVRQLPDPLAFKEVASKCQLVGACYMAFAGWYSTARFDDDVDKAEIILSLNELSKDIIVMFRHNFFEKLYRLLTVEDRKRIYFTAERIDVRLDLDLGNFSEDIQTNVYIDGEFLCGIKGL